MKNFNITAVAALARLELSEAARGALSSDMEATVSLADSLSPSDDNTDACHSCNGNKLREDTVAPSLPRDDLLSAAPCQRNGFFAVARTVKEENE